MESLGNLGHNVSFAYGINNSGEIVGAGYPPLPSEYQGFFWSENGGMVQLYSPDNSVTEARKINSRDMIIGSSSGTDGAEHFILWVRQR
jgi:uncharacterized membrane protein